MKTMRNSVKLIGRPGNDPQVTVLANERKMARFSLATNEFYTNDAGERKSLTHWHNLVAWGKTAEMIGAFVKKGREIAIEGRLVNRSYEYPSGVTRYVSEVVINEIMIIEKAS